MSTPMTTLDTSKYLSRQRHTPKQVTEIEAWAEKLPTLSADAYVKKAADMIWLSAYAANNPLSAYHPMCDLCYDEAVRRGNTDLYSKAHKKAMRDAGHGY